MRPPNVRRFRNLTPELEKEIKDHILTRKGQFTVRAIRTKFNVKSHSINPLLRRLKEEGLIEEIDRTTRINYRVVK